MKINQIKYKNKYLSSYFDKIEWKYNKDDNIDKRKETRINYNREIDNIQELFSVHML